MRCLYIACFTLAIEIVVISLIFLVFDENAAAEVVKRGVLIAFKY